MRLAVAFVAAATLTGATTVTKATVGRAPCAEIGAYGSVWVANAQPGTLSRIDPATNEVIGTVKVGAGPCGVVAGAGSLWVDGYGTDSVERVNPVTMKRVKSIPAGPQVWDVAFDGRYVWADDNVGAGVVLKIDPRANKVVKRIVTGGHPTGLAFAYGSIWVGSNGFTDRRFFRIAVASGKVTRVSPGCQRPAYFAVSDGADVWVTCVGDDISPGVAIRVDPKSNAVLARVPVGVNPGDGAIDDHGRVWIPNKNDGTVDRIDPATNTVAETVSTGGTPFVVNAAFGDVWVPDAAGNTVARLHVDEG